MVKRLQHTTSAAEMLRSILTDLENMGVGSDDAIDGGDAVEYLNALRDDLKAFFRG